MEARAEMLRQIVARGKISEAIVGRLLSWRQTGSPVLTGAPVESSSETARLDPHWIEYGHPPFARARALNLNETSGEVISRTES